MKLKGVHDGRVRGRVRSLALGMKLKGVHDGRSSEEFNIYIYYINVFCLLERFV